MRPKACRAAVTGRSGWEALDIDGNRIAPAFTYIAEGTATDGRPSLRYLTLLRNGARAHDLPEHWLRYLESVRHAE